jgi:hypothetical protein
MSWTPIKAVYVTAATTVPAEVSGLNVRIRGIYFQTASVGGEVVINHASANGAQIVKFGAPSSSSDSPGVPDAGLRCESGFYVSQPADCRLTIYYG